MISLKKYSSLPTYANKSGIHAFPLEIVAEASEDFPTDKIFVYQVGTTSDDPNNGDIFTNVASLLDLEEIPAVSANINEDLGDILQNPYYRDNTVKLLFRTQSELEETWDKFKWEVQQLVNNFKASTEMQLIETVVVTPN